MPKNIKIFLSSVQHVSTVVPANFEPYYVLESYWYLKSNGKQTKQLMNWFLKAKMFLLDSGAFTFMNCKNKKTDFDAYVDGYIKFINDWDVKYFFEMDLDALMPYSEVLKLRERIENGTGKRCIPVWHKSRGREEWTKMCQEYDIVAIGGIASKEIKPAENAPQFFIVLITFSVSLEFNVILKFLKDCGIYMKYSLPFSYSIPLNI